MFDIIQNFKLYAIIVYIFVWNLSYNKISSHLRIGNGI